MVLVCPYRGIGTELKECLFFSHTTVLDGVVPVVSSSPLILYRANHWKRAPQTCFEESVAGSPDANPDAGLGDHLPSYSVGDGNDEVVVTDAQLITYVELTVSWFH